MKVKQTIFISAILIFLAIEDYKYLQHKKVEGQPHFIDTGYECGTIIDNFTNLRNIKYGTRTDYYLKVKYSNRTVIESVGAKTFYDRNKVGSVICLGRHEVIPFIQLASMFISLGVLLALCLYLTYLLLAWVFGD